MICVFDIDGVIAKTDFVYYEDSAPIPEVIEKINELYEAGHYIKIWTSRGILTGRDLREFTEKQLKKWGVKFHELVMGKPYYDLLVDDKAMSVKEWMDGNRKSD